jgi:hypothetical protein
MRFVVLVPDRFSWRAAFDRIEAVRREALRKKDPEGQAEALEWVEWAERQADRIDPLKPSPPSLLDDKEKVIRRQAV